LAGEDVPTYRSAVLQRRNQSVGLEHLWSCLQQRGQVEGTLRQALRPGQKSITELVDNYPIRSSRVRALLIAYLTERSLAVDYSTLRALVADLCNLYWLAVESIAPGIDTIDLPPEVATAWKEQVRWRHQPDGKRVPRRNAMNVLMSVRGFYADLLQLAYDDPARWAQWPCTAPVSANEVKRYHKWRSQLRSEMHERTRVRTVKVANLADAAERTYHHARRLYDAAQSLPSGGRVTVAGATCLRSDAAAPRPSKTGNAAAGLVGVDGTMIAFTAHDFRRVFATDALAAGLPPHIIQKLMGHASIATTQGQRRSFPRTSSAPIAHSSRTVDGYGRPRNTAMSARQSGTSSMTTSLSARSPSATACVPTAPAASTNTPASNANSLGQTPARNHDCNAPMPDCSNTRLTIKPLDASPSVVLRSRYSE